MAQLALGAPLGGVRLASALAGGTISSGSTTQMTYTSTKGYLVTITGTGLTYDADGFPSGGTVTGMTVQKGGSTYATFTFLNVNFARAGMWLLGYDDGTGTQAPDPYSLIENGLRGADFINGSAGVDDIIAGVGSDTIEAGGGGDIVSDEAGDDVMNGGAGWDTLSYSLANVSTTSAQGVSLDAQNGVAYDPWGFRDTFEGFEAFRDTNFNDTLFGSAVNEDFWVNRGNDVIDGRLGSDWLIYAQAHEYGATHGITVNVSTGKTLDSWAGTDSFTGIEGFRGTIFADVFIGSTGDDHFNGDRGIDNFSGGTGSDWLEYWSVGRNKDGGSGVSVDLTQATEVINDGYGNAENADSFENINGSMFADSLIGNETANILWGVLGNDTLTGRGGADSIYGGGQRDRINGNDGDDFLGGGAGQDVLTGGTGQDTFAFSGSKPAAGVDHITDFEATDRILVDVAWGGGFLATNLTADQFLSGAGVTSATTATQRFLYNTTTGELYLDIDGTGATAAFLFATLDNMAALDFTDIQIWL